ncbi:MAG: UvrD-helicase domain-containing protein [Bacteroidales bacterium]|nr:UvrD-helicase domain-containing protein [Bacteroidales bacterium]
MAKPTDLNYLSGLNQAQAEAVTHGHNRLLVLAGAGSGKTRALISRIGYLLFAKNVKPRNILAITFTKDAANEMIDRLIEQADTSGRFKQEIGRPGLDWQHKYDLRKLYARQFPWISQVTLCTFHSFCYKLLKEKGVHQFDNRFKIITNQKDQRGVSIQSQCPETIMAVMQKVLIEACEKPEFLLQLKRYILDFYVDKIEVAQYDRISNYQKPFTTLRGEKVRSKSEQFIADWLYRHNIRYQYELAVNFADFVFRPDFYVPEANLYIEHNSDKSSPMHNKEKQFKKLRKPWCARLRP